MPLPMAALLLLVLLAVPAAHSLQYGIAWNEGINYKTWVSGKIFTVGDTLLFIYTRNHKVDIVDPSAYTSCNSGNAIESYSGGQTNITLTTAGPMYFICPVPGHCQNGMKLSITVVEGATSSPNSTSSSPAVTTSPLGSSSGTTPAITTTTSSPNSSVGGNFGNKNSWVIIGFSVVVAGLVGFMG